MTRITAGLKSLFFRDLGATFQRFPLPAFFCVAITLIAIFPAMAEQILGKTEAARLAIWSVLAYPVSIGTTLFGEVRYWSRRRSFLFAAACSVALYAGLFLIYSIPQRLVFFIPAVLLFSLLAPFLFRQAKDEESCYFNLALLHSFFVATIASWIFCGSVSLILLTLKYLFGVPVPLNFYAHLWIIGSILLAGIYFLSGIPKMMGEFAECSAALIAPITQRANTSIVGYLLAPMVLVYLAIVVAYGLRIAVLQEMPKGMVGPIVIGLGVVGMITHLFCLPLYRQGSWAASLLYRFFYPAFLIPTAMLGYSIALRIQQHGVTEWRYAVALMVLWFGLSGIYMLLSREKSVRQTLTLLMALLLLASAGPWGAVQISRISQMSRLEALLIQEKILKEDSITAANPEKVSINQSKKISAILDYLCSRKMHIFLQKWLPNLPLTATPQQVADKLGVYYSAEWERRGKIREERRINAYFPTNKIRKIIPVAGYEYLIANISLYYSDPKGISIANGKDVPITGCEDLRMRLEKAEMVIFCAGNAMEWRFDFAPFLEKLPKNKTRYDVPEEWKNERYLTAKTDKIEIQIHMNNVSFAAQEKANHLKGMGYDLLLRKVK